MFKTIDSIAERGEGVILLLGRLAIGALFLPTGLRKLLDPAAFAGNLSQYGMIEPLIFWAVVAAIVEFFGTLAVVVGYKTRLAALLLLVFCIAAALLGHQYWLIADPLPRRNQFIHFWKDIALAGGMLFIFVRGAGPLSIDRR